MAKVPQAVTEFLSGKRFAVVGVSRQSGESANVVFRKLRQSGYEVVPVNPNASELEGTRCYADLSSIPGLIDVVVVATHPDVSVEVVRQCGERCIERVWFHRSFGPGSVSEPAVAECGARGIRCIVGGCPMMFCEPVDFGHRCMRAWLNFAGRLPH